MTEKKLKIFGYRLTKEQEEQLEKVAKDLENGKKRQFLIRATAFFERNPELYRLGKVQTANDTITKDDLLEFKDEIFSKLKQQRESIQQMAQLIADQKANGIRTDYLAAMKEKLLSSKTLSDLDTYGKVEDYLLEVFPEWEIEISEDKLYNEVLYGLMQTGILQYNTRSKKFKWSVTEE